MMMSAEAFFIFIFLESWARNIQVISHKKLKADWLRSSSMKKDASSLLFVASTCDGEEVGALLPADRNLLFLLSDSIIWHPKPPPLFQLRL